VNQGSAPRNTDTLRLKDSAQRSWGTVETAGRHPAALVIGANSQGFADDAPSLDQDCRRQDPGKVRMQCAAGISEVSATITVMMVLACVGVVGAVLMVIMRGSCVRSRLCVGARRRHDAGELGDDE